MHRLSALFVVTLAAGASRAEAALDVTVAPAMVKVRPARPLPPEARRGPVELEAVRGECEDAHLVVTAGPRPVLGLAAAASPLRGPGDARVPLELFREAFLEVKTPSDVDGATGLWPDPLVPAVDAVAHEPRRAFPVDVPARTHQPLLVEACVPRGAPPGRYDGAVTLTAGPLTARVEVHLVVRPLAIPATSTLPVSFGLSGRSLMYGHFGEKRGDDERRRLVDRYARLALAYRVSLHTMSRIPPLVTHRPDGTLAVDFRAWDAEIGPFMDGSALPSGARFSAVDLRTPDDLPAADLPVYARAVAAHFRERGWLSRLFAYVMDEPKAADRAELRRRLEALAGSGVPRLVTMPLDESLAGLVDWWAPNLNCLDHKERQGEFCPAEAPREAYAPAQAKGGKLWWYQSCSSHGCGHGPFGDVRDAYFRGWPSYMVDADGAANRAMGWLAFAAHVDGELYFDTVWAFNRWDRTKQPRLDPWDDLFAFGGNGDGTLFYPGRPDRIGGTTDVPVASLRLVLLRDGLEDYELLRLLAARGPDGARRADELARGLAPRLFAFSRDPAAWAAARRALLDALAPPVPDVRPPARR